MPVKVHLHPELSTGAMYNRTQTDESFRNGDLFVCNGGETVGFLMSAWPTALYGLPGELHTFAPGGRTKYAAEYPETFERAQALATNMEESESLLYPLGDKPA